MTILASLFFFSVLLVFRALDDNLVDETEENCLVSSQHYCVCRTLTFSAFYSTIT